MKFKTIVLVLFLVIFASCATSGGLRIGGGNSQTEVDTSGNGLEVSFSFGSDWIKNEDGRKDLVNTKSYRLKIKNSGVDPITLSKDNFEISTKQLGTDGRHVIEQESLDDLYSKLFEGKNQREMEKDQEIEITGFIEIEDEYFKEKTHDKISVIIQASYPYTTEFAQSVTFIPPDDEFRVGLSQAAPLQVTRVEYTLDYRKLIFTLSDKGKSSSGTSSVEVEDLELQFSSQKLSCKEAVDFEGVKNFKEIKDLRLSSSTPNTELMCDVDLKKFEEDLSTTVQVTGNLKYKYILTLTKPLSFPQIREIPSFNE